MKFLQFFVVFSTLKTSLEYSDLLRSSGAAYTLQEAIEALNGLNQSIDQLFPAGYTELKWLVKITAEAAIFINGAPDTTTPGKLDLRSESTF